MNNQGAAVCRSVAGQRPEVDLHVGQRAGKREEMKNKGEGKPCQVEHLYKGVSSAPDRPEDEKEDPEKMNENSKVSE